MTRARLLSLGPLALLLVAMQLGAAVPAGRPADSSVGGAIYLNGVLGSGAPLEATRAEATALAGEAAACVNCHRRSGFGAREARSIVAPVTGRFLFHPKVGHLEDIDLPYVPSARPDREPYTEATLAHAIREGIDSEGRELSYLMPRFALGDADMAALIGYLKSLDRAAPGVSGTEIHFATIITPDADPVKRRGMLDVLEQFFSDRNAAQPGPVTHMMTSGKTAYSKTMFKVNRRWVLHVWELTGAPATWTEQLRKKFTAQPVFAAISGLGGRNWAPVHAFCEQQPLPCLFPNVELAPPDADRDFHSLYFSRGVNLEADLIAAAIINRGVAPRLVRQVYRRGDVGEVAAAALAKALKSAGIAVSSHELGAAKSPAGAVASLREPTSADTLVLWLRGPDLAALGSLPPATTVYLSGLMAGIDRPTIPESWRGQAHVAYPFDLPDQRRVRVDYALGWFHIRKIPVVAEQVQADTYLVCGLVSETLKHMIDALVPDYLVERLEDSLEHRVLTGYYPRLALGPHQRFASKGGYVVHVDASTRRLVPDGEWIAP